MERKTELEMFNELFELALTKGQPVVRHPNASSCKLNSLIAVEDKAMSTKAIFVEPFLSVFLIDGNLTVEVDPPAKNPAEFLRKLHAAAFGIDYYTDEEE